MDCIFCKIIDGKIPSPRVLEDENAIVIRDIQPHAKQHFLVIPKKHTVSIAELFETDPDAKTVTGNLFAMVNRLAKQEKLLPDGFRTVVNTGDFGGQTVHHLHIHVLGGEKLKGFFG